MNFFDLIFKRRSVRAYKNVKLDETSLEKILGACAIAPSAGNLQSYKIFVIQNPTIKNKLIETTNNQIFLGQASVNLLFCANPQSASPKYAERGASLYCMQDATIATVYAQLAATELGLDTCWVGAFDPKKVTDICSIDPNLIPVSILAIGTGDPAYEKRPFKRKEIKDLIEFI